MTILFAGGCLRGRILRLHGLQQFRSDVNQHRAAFGVRLGDEVGKSPGGQVARDFRHDVHFHEYGAFLPFGLSEKFSVSELVPSLSPPEMTSARRVLSNSCREILFTFAWTVRPGQSTSNFCDVFGRRADRRHGGNFPKGWNPSCSISTEASPRLRRSLTAGRRVRLKKARLVIFPFAVFMGEQQHQGVRISGFLAQPQIHLCRSRWLRPWGRLRRNLRTSAERARGAMGCRNREAGKGRFPKRPDCALSPGGRRRLWLSSRHNCRAADADAMYCKPRPGRLSVWRLRGGSCGSGRKKAAAQGQGENGTESHYTII